MPRPRTAAPDGGDDAVGPARDPDRNAHEGTVARGTWGETSGAVHGAWDAVNPLRDGQFTRARIDLDHDGDVDGASPMIFAGFADPQGAAAGRPGSWIPQFAEGDRPGRSTDRVRGAPVEITFGSRISYAITARIPCTKFCRRCAAYALVRPGRPMFVTAERLRVRIPGCGHPARHAVAFSPPWRAGPSGARTRTTARARRALDAAWTDASVRTL